MKELIGKIKNKLKGQVQDVYVAGPAEINIVVIDPAQAESLSVKLQEHIAEMADSTTIAEIRFIGTQNELLDRFPLNQ